MFPIRSILARSIAPSIYRNFARYVKQAKDPGINRRKKLLALEETEHEDVDIDDMESDFMDAHKLHIQHERELAYLKERQKYHIVKQKYFKEKFPNFLTWHDKEQIRYLHRTDPEEWTIEKLSEGFPALPPVLKKIVTSDWTKTKEHQIRNHDVSVQSNWKLFKEGKISNVPEDLKQHLNKFTNRALNLTPFVAPDTQTTTLQVNTKPASTEYADIIKSYEKLKKVPQIEGQQIVSNVEDKRPNSETYVAAKFVRSRSVTLNELKEKVAKKIEMGKMVDEEEKFIAKSLTVPDQATVTETPQKQMIDISHTKYQKPASVRNVQKTQRDLSHLRYPDKIDIPEDIFKKGYLYKLNDCYYDDDGQFLYRVPGMG